MRAANPLNRFLRLTGVLAALGLAGCATVGRAPVPEAAPDGIHRCARLFETVEAAVADNGVRDDETHVLEEHPWLRSNRFMATYRDEARGPGLDQWLDRLAALDARARSHELANLPEAPRRRLGDDLQERLSRCRETLVAFDRARPARVAEIREAARVPDAYIEWRRVLGLYPLAGWFILQGVEDWQAEVRATHAELPAFERARRYAPPGTGRPARDRVAGWLDGAADNPLGIPRPDRETARRLFRAFAPIFVVQTQGPFDRPGVPRRSARGVGHEPEPVVYARLSHARYRGKAVLQLNYLVWFSARPRAGPFDMLGGRLDGVYWRVTLGPDGRPLLYDSMHACGCYHMAFPAGRLEPRPPAGGLREPLLVPRRAPEGEGRMTVFLESGTHYLVGIARGGAPARNPQTYALRDYHALRSGPGARGLFGEHGIVPGTDRREEIFFWPTGVRAPGAMRQWGTHATAFVGHRHFDDPDLIERYFRPRDPGAAR